MQIVRLLFTGLIFFLLASAHAELVGSISSKFGTIYFTTETQSECPNDQQTVFMQPNGKFPDGPLRVYKMPGCWSERHDGKLLANWPGLGITEHKLSDLQKVPK